ncbi:hypothetical protein Tco_0274448, partial [Tanacetum coccineum]
NWLTNHSGDDVADFAIALRMFTRSLILEKGTRTLHTKTLKDSFMKGHQQAAKGKEDDEEFGEIRWW